MRPLPQVPCCEKCCALTPHHRMCPVLRRSPPPSPCQRVGRSCRTLRRVESATSSISTTARSTAARELPSPFTLRYYVHTTDSCTKTTFTHPGFRIRCNHPPKSSFLSFLNRTSVFFPSSRRRFSMSDALQHPFLRQKAEVEPLVSYEQVPITNSPSLLNLLRLPIVFRPLWFQIAGPVQECNARNTGSKGRVRCGCAASGQHV
jgi:hypothetical protein